MNAIKKYLIFPIMLAMFDNTNVTTDSGMTVQMKEFYDKVLLTSAEPELVHDQFGQKRNIPANSGNIIKFRRFATLPKALTPLTEGVTPTGTKISSSEISATVHQYGAYTEFSDILLLETIDNNMVEATKLLGSQAGRTLDTITREVLNGGTNVQYGEGLNASRYSLVGGEASGNDYLTVRGIRSAVRTLAVVNASKPSGNYYVGIIHPDAKYDLMDDPDWKYPKQYVEPSDLYNNEIGTVAGVRFVESTEAKVFHAADLSAGARNLTVKTTLGAPGLTVAIDEVLTADDATALVGRKILMNANQYTIASAVAGAAGSATITATTNITVADGTDGIVIYPGEAGAKGRDIYSTLILGDNAYGTTEVEGGGLQHIVKPLGSAGAADPLNQRATVGWKAIKTAVRLSEEYMVRVETASTFQLGSSN